MAVTKYSELDLDDYRPKPEISKWCDKVFLMATRSNPSAPEIAQENASWLETLGYDICHGSENLTRLVQTIKNLRGY